jgi:predicted nucleic acid-binding protein
MGIILDSSVIIAGERGLLDFQTWIASRSQDHFAIAAITVAELWHGVHRADDLRRPKRAAFVSSILNALPIIPYTENIAFRHAAIWSALVNSGKLIESHDLILAATALERGDAVATLNARHFREVPDLIVVEPEVNR